MGYILCNKKKNGLLDYFKTKTKKKKMKEINKFG